jgi:hypothetical protein
MRLIDRHLPRYIVTEVHDIEVNADAASTYEAIRRADLRDPLVTTLFAIRELPDRLARRLRGESPPPPPPSVTFGDLATPAMGWVLLEEDPGHELVLGSVGRFWRHDYGWRPVTAAEFARFEEPGFAKIAISLRVHPIAGDRSLLRYEARTATTDAEAHRRFRRYWRVIRPGVALVMWRALVRIREEAERVPAPT